ncbi:hypothetical protein AVEN_82377-1 [Araneus ventricosus]|uniref:Uncharacterized protein n=1 Tax=Araneus ventricosus TaxID=182803 RepID=A0A4Y2HIP9_ARAVE|nr:hypothetical protein AVEN_82377-1 [Araneus ventricosus]
MSLRSENALGSSSVKKCFHFSEDHDGLSTTKSLHCNTPKKRTWVWIGPRIRQITIHAGFFFLLWGNLKHVVYRRNPIKIEDLVQIVRDDCETIPITTLENAVANFHLRLRHVVATDVAHFENIVMLFPRGLKGSGTVAPPVGELCTTRIKANKKISDFTH